MRNSLAIKNLSIALEALSHMPGYENQSYRINQLLETCLTEDEKPTEPYVKPQQLSPDEEIPF